MQELTFTLVSILHPGDLGLGGLLVLFIVFNLLMLVPILVVGFIIYKAVKRK